MRDDGKLDGLLLRRRVVPVRVEIPDNIFTKTFRKINGICNRHRSLEALDLATKDSAVVFKFDQDYGKLWEMRFRSHLNWFDDKPWETHFRSSLNRRRRRVLLIYALLVVLVSSLLLIFVVLFAGMFGWLQFLDLTTLDRYLCGDVNPGPYPCTITANPDVAGIGTRIALYMQTFLLAVLLSFSPKKAKPVSWTIVSTSTAFVLSGIITMATSKLTLYHATLIAKMQGLPITVLTIVEIFPPRQRGPYIFLLHIFRLALGLAVLTWVSVKAPCFGSQRECNAHVVTQGLFVPTMAIASTPRVSSLCLVIIAFTFRLLLLVLFPKNITVALRSLFSGDANREWYGMPEGLISRRQPVTWVTLFCGAVLSIFDDNSTPSFVKQSAPQASDSLPNPVTITTTDSSQPPLSNKFWTLYQTISLNIRGALCYPKVWRLMIAFSVGSWLVYNIEATILSNTVDDEEKAWTYGQILALMLTIVPVVQVLQLFGLGPFQRKKVGRKDKVL